MLFNPNECRINSALVKIQSILRDLLDPVGNAIGMLRAHGGKGAKDHEAMIALENWGRGLIHLAFK
jgi:hypothetical protein